MPRGSSSVCISMIDTHPFSLNPSATISGLRRTITDILLTNPALVKGNGAYYEGFLSRLPETPLQPCPGATGAHPPYSNTNDISQQVFNELPPPPTIPIQPPASQPRCITTGIYCSGWRQDQIWFARQGLTEQAKNDTIERFSDSTSYHFPAFKGPNYDWPPDINHYGSAAVGLQGMLVQTFARNNSQIRLLPAWPREWRGEFRLFAPHGTRVEGRLGVEMWWRGWLLGRSGGGRD